MTLLICQKIRICDFFSLISGCLLVTFVCSFAVCQSPLGPLRPWICPLRPEIYPLRPAICPFRPWIWNFRPERADFRPEGADFRADRADFRTKRAYFRPERTDFRPERAWGGLSDGNTNRCSSIKVPCSTGLHPLWGCCPKRTQHKLETYTFYDCQGASIRGCNNWWFCWSLGNEYVPQLTWSL